MARAASGQVGEMPYDDDDDWVGTPPEGRYSADRADPGFWARNWPVLRWMGVGMVALVVLVLILALT